jgi:hypothetical protein
MTFVVADQSVIAAGKTVHTAALRRRLLHLRPGAEGQGGLRKLPVKITFGQFTCTNGWPERGFERPAKERRLIATATDLL